MCGGNYQMLRPEEDLVPRCEKCGKELKDEDPEDSELCLSCKPDGDDIDEAEYKLQDR